MKIAILSLVLAVILSWPAFVPDEQHHHDSTDTFSSTPFLISHAPTVQICHEEAERIVA